MSSVLDLIDNEIYRRKCINSLHFFVKESWHIIDPNPFLDGKHIVAICEHLQAVTDGRIRNLIINIPPRHGKSLITGVFWFAWVWLKDPSKRFLCSSYSQTLSNKDSVFARTLIESDWYRKLRNFTLLGDQNTKIRFNNDKFGHRIATSVGGSLTGDGGDVILIDDPLNAVDAESEAKRQSMIEWWDLAMSTRLNDPMTGVKVIICQRLHHQDLVGHILSKEPEKWEKLILPLEYEADEPRESSIGFKDWRTEEGEYLWKDRYDEEYIESLKKSLGSYGTAGQLQQRPSPREGGLIHLDWIKEYTVLPNVKRWSWSWDTAIKDKEANDYSVGTLWAECENGYYLVDTVRKKMQYPELRKTVEFCYNKQRSSEVLVEDKASGQQIIQDFMRITKMPVIAMMPNKNMPGSKYERVCMSAPVFEAGKIFVKKGASWYNDVVDELISFPTSAHDDIVDSITQYICRRLASATIRIRSF